MKETQDVAFRQKPRDAEGQEPLGRLLQIGLQWRPEKDFPLQGVMERQPANRAFRPLRSFDGKRLEVTTQVGLETTQKGEDPLPLCGDHLLAPL